MAPNAYSTRNIRGAGGCGGRRSHTFPPVLAVPSLRSRPARAEVLAPLAAWTVLVVAALVWGTLAVADAGVSWRAAPLMGHWRGQAGPVLLPVALGGLVVVARGPELAARLAGRRMALAGATGVVAMAWTVGIAATGGWDRVTAPLTTRHEYEPFAARVTGIGDLVRGYAGHLAGTPVHVQGHPPGPVVLAWAFDRIGLGGAGWLAALAVAGWGTAAAAAVWAVGTVAGPDAARRAAPVLAALPAAIWAGTSMDALFAGVLAVAVALGAAAAVANRAGLAAAAGAVLGVALLMTYGAAPFVAIEAVLILVLAPADRRCRLLAAAAAGVVVPLAVAAAAGFWWPAGLLATSSRYWAGVGAARPALYATVLGNPAALALAVGPAVAVGMVALGRAGGSRATRAGLLPAAVLAAVVVADLSQMSRGEVERIWLPFVPWLALAAPGDRRGLLALQVSTALRLQSTLASPW